MDSLFRGLSPLSFIFSRFFIIICIRLCPLLFLSLLCLFFVFSLYCSFFRASGFFPLLPHLVLLVVTYSLLWNYSMSVTAILYSFHFAILFFYYYYHYFSHAAGVFPPTSSFNPLCCRLLSSVPLLPCALLGVTPLRLFPTSDCAAPEKYLLRTSCDAISFSPPHLDTQPPPPTRPHIHTHKVTSQLTHLNFHRVVVFLFLLQSCFVLLA